MKVVCTACVPEEKKRQNMVDCVRIIGAEATVEGDTIYVEYDGNIYISDKLIALFQHYPYHGISIMDD